jgi:Glycosyltransferase family 87
MMHYTILTYRNSISRFVKQTTTILRIAAILCVIVGVYFLVKSSESLQPPDSLTVDFPQEYYLARTFIDGSNPYQSFYYEYSKYVPEIANYNPDSLISKMDGKRIGLFNQDRSKELPTPHPPTVGLLLSPLGFLDYDSAIVLWWGLELLLIFGSVYINLRIHCYQNSLLKSIAITIALYAWVPIITEIILGQVESLILFLLSLSLFFAMHKYPQSKILAGMCWGASLAIKPISAFLAITFVLRKETTIIFSASLTLFAMICLTAWRYGFGVLYDYITRVIPIYSVMYRGFRGNLSLLSIPYIMTESTTIAAIISILLVIGSVLFVLLFHRRFDRQYPEQFSAAIISGVLTSPISWIHYWILFVIPILSIPYRMLSTNSIYFLGISILLLNYFSRAQETDIPALQHLLYSFSPFIIFYLSTKTKPFRDDTPYAILRQSKNELLV